MLYLFRCANFLCSLQLMIQQKLFHLFVAGQTIRIAVLGLVVAADCRSRIAAHVVP